MSGQQDRHLSPDGLGQFLAAGVRATVPLEGEPAAQLQIDPPSGELALDVAWPSDLSLELEPYARLAVDVVHHDGQRWARISIHGSDVLQPAYPVLCAIADRVQQDGLPLNGAVRESLHRYRMLLETQERLSTDAEIGLFGELLVLRHLLSVVGPEEGLAAWLGTLGEEHDFSLPELDLEVKTTQSERRRHWIGSLTQLVAAPDRDLWLVSVQVTAAGAAADGRTLSGLIDEIRSSLASEERSAFDGGLSEAGYTHEAARLYTRLLVLRASPAAFDTSVAAFPRLTPEMLDGAGADLSRIPEVSYTVDLSGLPPGHLDLLAGLITGADDG